MTKSGDECKESGDYKAECSQHSAQRPYKEGDIFTMCPRSMQKGDVGFNELHRVNWIKV